MSCCQKSPTVDLPQNSWSPISPCGLSCVAHVLRPVSPLRRAVRCVRFGAALACTVCAAPFVPVLASRSRDRVIRWCARIILSALGIRVRTQAHQLSAAGTVGSLIVANHVSWLDSLALMAIEPITPLAAQEIADAPLVRLLNRMVGTCYIERKRLRALPNVVREVATVLCSGRSVAVSPEGTTWCGHAGEHVGGLFRLALFQAAIDAGAPVRPVTVRYSQGTGPSTVAAYVGEGTLFTSVIEVIGARDLIVDVQVHPELCPSAGNDHGRMARRRLAIEAHRAVTNNTACSGDATC